MTVGIFAKNHASYLRSAAEVGAASPERLVTFQSKKRWVRARDLIDTRGAGGVSVLFAVVDGGPVAEYHAWLQEAVIDPQPDDPRTQKLLGLRLESTSGEELWSEGGGTLYAVSGCHRLDPVLPYSKLIKASDGTPLSDTYRYSYSVVVVPAELGVEEAPAIAVDIDAPPPVYRSVVTRRIRDAAIVRRLKALHDDRCQRCGTRLELADGSGYSEGHHLRPLGGDHNGPDVEENIVVLCPNCHALFDLGAVLIHGETLAAAAGHALSPMHIEYHNEKARKRGAR